MSSRQYYPILKSRRGEGWALKNLSLDRQSFILPVVEVAPKALAKEHKGDEEKKAESIDNNVRSFAKQWGGSFGVDLSWVPGHADQVFAVLDEIAPGRWTPVISTGVHVMDIPVLQSRLGKNSSPLIRVAPKDLGAIQSIVKLYSLDERHCDLLVDFVNQPMTFSKIAGSIASISKWRTLISSSGTYPLSFSGDLMQWKEVPRECWLSWRRALRSKTVTRKPMFSDYATRAPGRPADGGFPSPNVRYATDDLWMVMQADQLRNGGSEPMRDICQSLLSSDFYYGRDFSAGDLALGQTAEPESSLGNPESWVKWSLSHHLEKVLSDLVATS